MRGSLKWTLTGTALTLLVVLGTVGGAAGGWFDLAWIVAIAAVAGLVFTVFWDRLQGPADAGPEFDDDPELDAVTEALTSPAAAPGAPEELSAPAPEHITALLAPAARVVPFTGREKEAAALRDWCRGGPGATRLALVTGPGGTGRTRLALHLADELRAEGWTCRRVLDGAEAEVVGVAGSAAPGPVLLVVDHAETRPGLPQLLAAATAGGASRLRVLMLAHGEGDWWEQLRAAAAPVGPAVSGALTLRLPADPGTGRGLAELVSDAVPQFARRLGLPAPGSVEAEPPAGPVPLLVPHAAALVAVLRGRDGAGPVPVRADFDVLDELLRHAERAWHDSARRAGITGADGLGGTALRQCVALAGLLAPPDEEAAAEVLRAVPGLGAGTEAALRRRTAAWLAALHPDGAGGVAPLRPAVLAERLAASALHDSPELAAAVRDRLDVVQALRALTVLNRAASHYPHAAALLEDWLGNRLAALHRAAITVAIETPGPLGGVLASVLARTDAGDDVLEQVLQAIPYPSPALAEARLALTGRIVERLPKDSAPEQRARWLTTLGLQYGRAGRLEEALEPAREAVALHRKLAADAPDRFLPDLAGSLTNLGTVLSELERHDEALAPAREAAELYRELAGDAPGRFRPGLAGSLNNLGVVLAGLGRTEEALDPAREAVGIRRELARDAPERFRPGLARSLDNLGERLAALGREEEARRHWEESAALFRAGATADPGEA